MRLWHENWQISLIIRNERGCVRWKSWNNSFERMGSRGKKHVVTLLSLPDCAWTWSGLFRMSFLPLNYVHCCFDRCCQNALKGFWFAMQGKVIVTQRYGKKEGCRVWYEGSKYFLLQEWPQCFLWTATSKCILQQKISQVAEAGIHFVPEQHAKAGLSRTGKC